MGKNTPITAAAYLKKALKEIAAWENFKRNYFERIGDKVLGPAARLTAKTVPQSLQRSVGKVVQKSLRSLVQSGKFSVDFKGIGKERNKRLGRTKVLGQQLRIFDSIATRYWAGHCAYAAAEGAAAGAIGFAGILADIPLILSIAIREIRTIGLCYGYPTTEPEETEYLLHVLRIGSSGDPQTRAKSLTALKILEQEQISTALEPGSSKTRERKRKPARVKHLVSIQEYSKSLAFDLVHHRAFQMIPLVGIVTGASFNAAYANDIGRAAYMCYRRRFLLERGEVLSTDS